MVAGTGDRLALKLLLNNRRLLPRGLNLGLYIEGESAGCTIEGLRKRKSMLDSE